MAIASLVFGMLGASCLLPVVGGIAGLILGLIARHGINRSGGALRGKGLAMGGMVAGSLGIVLAAILLPALVRAKPSHHQARCASNLKQIGLGLAMYYDDKRAMPAKLTDILPYLGNNAELLTCPYATDKTQPTYQLIAITTWGTEPLQVVVIEADSDHRGQHGHNQLYNDGHVEWIEAPK